MSAFGWENIEVHIRSTVQCPLFIHADSQSFLFDMFRLRLCVKDRLLVVNVVIRERHHLVTECGSDFLKRLGLRFAV